ncbi:hypothetical protein [Sphingomonas prati]|nr:hypothetical protein [Sphingomonas prati]
MMDDASLGLWVACALGAGAVGVLRGARSLERRASGWNSLGWGLIVASVLSGWAAAGAWGVSVAALVTMGAAFVALTVAAIRCPRGRAVAAGRRVAVQAREPRAIGRRVTTFVMVMPGGFAAAILLALGLRWLGLAVGWGEANANVAALYAVPVGWAVLITILLMQVRRRSQVATLLVSGATGLPMLMGAVA